MKEKEGRKTVERVEVFNYGENAPVRVRVIKGQPWFVAKDVCKVLEFSDAEAATRLLDDDEKLNLLVVGSGQRRNMIHISESGLYHLLLQSRKPKAKPFRRLVPETKGRKRHRFIGKREVFEKKVCGGVHGIGIYLPAGAGDQRAQAPQIYREKRFFLKKSVRESARY